MKKLLLVLGVTATIMLSCVGCRKEVKEDVKTTSIYETTTDERYGYIRQIDPRQQNY